MDIIGRYKTAEKYGWQSTITIPARILIKQILPASDPSIRGKDPDNVVKVYFV